MLGSRTLNDQNVAQVWKITESLHFLIALSQICERGCLSHINHCRLSQIDGDLYTNKYITLRQPERVRSYIHEHAERVQSLRGLQGSQQGGYVFEWVPGGASLWL